MKLAVAGLGYVGLSNAVLLSQHQDVFAYDTNPQRVESIRQKISPVEDADISDFLANRPLRLTATDDISTAFEGADWIIIATPTSYDPETNRFDTSSVEDVVAKALAIAPQAWIVIRSTVPVGYVDALRQSTGHERIFFVPEFLREGRALWDNLNPSRVVIGTECRAGRDFADLLLQGANLQGVPVMYCGPADAEAIKLFANTYLAMRVAYFNELDSYALAKGLESQQVIAGVGLDPRIGNHYNNPSFGYGGYCLPKDTKQLLANYDQVPQNLIAAIVDSNRTRKDFIAKQITAKHPEVVGIHRLVMKAGSDNFRDSSIQGIMRRLTEAGIKMIVYEPALPEEQFFGSPVVRNLEEFKSTCDLVLANRMTEDIMDIEERVYTRDLYGTD